MLDTNLIQSTSSWPSEVRKLKGSKELIKKRTKLLFKQGMVQGFLHIGTFGEVNRTSMMINALNHIQKLITS